MLTTETLSGDGDEDVVVFDLTKVCDIRFQVLICPLVITGLPVSMHKIATH